MALVGLLSIEEVKSLQLKHDSVWDDALGDVDASEYTQEAPKGYIEKEKPKIDYKAIAQRKKEAAALVQKEAEDNEKLEKDLEDMNIELYTFSKSLKPSSFHKALNIKEKLDESNHAPKHFRVSLVNMWSKGFKHDAVANYAFVKEKLQDLDVAEKNLNRNIDSKAQLDIFLTTANDVKSSFKKRYGEKEWEP